MIAELEAEVDKQALLRNHEVITSVLVYNSTFICSYGKLYSLKSKLDKKLNKLNKDYCIIEKDDLIEKIKRCNIELSEAIKCGSCCFCSFAARQVVRAERAEKQKEQKLMAYFDEYCKLMSEEYSNFDPIKAKKELDEILAKKQ